MAKLQKDSSGDIPHLVTLEDISALISHSEDLQDALKRVVTVVVERMETEVCSIYLLDSQRNRLILAATTGLDSDSVGKVSMDINEGLTGLVIEQMRPVVVVDALTHPRYKYFPETGEDLDDTGRREKLVELRHVEIDQLGAVLVHPGRGTLDDARYFTFGTVFDQVRL